MSGVQNLVPPTVAQPALHPSNITGNPVTTILGVTSVIQGVAASIPGGQLPTSPMGWAVLGSSLLMGLLGLFSK